MILNDRNTSPYSIYSFSATRCVEMKEDRPATAQ